MCGREKEKEKENEGKLDESMTMICKALPFVSELSRSTFSSLKQQKQEQPSIPCAVLI